MTRQQILDLYFMDARSKLIDIAAFLDRVDRGEGDPDFRLEAFRKALTKLQLGEPVPPWNPSPKRPEKAPSGHGRATARPSEINVPIFLRSTPFFTCATSNPTDTWSAASRTITRR
jgi:hypothetical protein